MWYWIFRTVFLIISKIFFGLSLEGLEHIPRKTNFIIVANHASYLDFVFIGAALPKKIHWIAFKGFYKIFWMRWFLQMVETVPSGCSSAKALSLLREGKNIGLFPEGNLSRDGSLNVFKRGVALLALKTGRPIVPCAILGAHRALPPGARFPKFVAVKIKIGEPIYLLKEYDEIIDDAYLQQGIFRVRNKVKEMLDAG